MVLNDGYASFNEVDAVIVCQDEEKYITKVLNNIYKCVDDIIILDGGSKDGTIDVIKTYKKEIDYKDKIKLYRNKFNGILGDQKNIAISKTNSLFALVIDCDETLCDDLVKDFRKIIRENQTKDLIDFIRFNYIDGKPEKLVKEYQLRLFKSFCRYVGTSHHELVGWQHQLRIELPEKYYMIHEKTTERSNKNTKFYKFIDAKYPYKNNNLSRFINYDYKDNNE